MARPNEKGSGLCSIRDARECNGHINWGTSACVQTGTPGHEHLQQTCFVPEAEIWHDPMSGTPLRPVQYRIVKLCPTAE